MTSSHTLSNGTLLAQSPSTAHSTTPQSTAGSSTTEPQLNHLELANTPSSGLDTLTNNEGTDAHGSIPRKKRCLTGSQDPILPSSIIRRNSRHAAKQQRSRTPSPVQTVHQKSSQPLDGCAPITPEGPPSDPHPCQCPVAHTSSNSSVAYARLCGRRKNPRDNPGSGTFKPTWKGGKFLPAQAQVAMRKSKQGDVMLLETNRLDRLRLLLGPDAVLHSTHIHDSPSNTPRLSLLTNRWIPPNTSGSTQPFPSAEIPSSPHATAQPSPHDIRCLGCPGEKTIHFRSFLRHCNRQHVGVNPSDLWDQALYPEINPCQACFALTPASPEGLASHLRSSPTCRPVTQAHVPPIPHLTTLPQHITCLKCQQTFPSSSFLHHCRTTHRHTPHRELWSPSLSPFYRQCGVCWTLCPIGTFSSHIRKGDCCATPGMAQIAIQDPITSAPAEWQCCRCTFTCTDPATYLAHLSFHLQGLPPESLDAWIINPAYSHIVQHCSLCNLFYYNPHSSSVSSTHDCPPPSPRPTNTTSTSLRTALPRPPLHFLKPTTESLTLLHHATPPLPDHVPFQESLHSPCPTLAPTSGFVAPSPSPPLATTARIALLDNTSTVLGSSLLPAVAPSPNPQLRLRVTAAVMVQETAAHHPTSSLATPPPSPSRSSSLDSSSKVSNPPPFSHPLQSTELATRQSSREPPLCFPFHPPVPSPPPPLPLQSHYISIYDADYAPGHTSDEVSPPDPTNCDPLRCTCCPYLTYHIPSFLVHLNSHLPPAANNAVPATIIPQRYGSSIFYCPAGEHFQYWPAKQPLALNPCDCYLPSDDMGTFMCGVCHSKFDSLYLLQLHFGDSPCGLPHPSLFDERASSTALPPFRCTLCDYESPRIGACIAHIQSHYEDLRVDPLTLIPQSFLHCIHFCPPCDFYYFDDIGTEAHQLHHHGYLGSNCSSSSFRPCALTSPTATTRANERASAALLATLRVRPDDNLYVLSPLPLDPSPPFSTHSDSPTDNVPIGPPNIPPMAEPHSHSQVTITISEPPSLHTTVPRAYPLLDSFSTITIPPQRQCLPRGLTRPLPLRIVQATYPSLTPDYSSDSDSSYRIFPTTTTSTNGRPNLTPPPPCPTPPQCPLQIILVLA